jgi:arylsulfatase A-like enzyme
MKPTARFRRVSSLVVCAVLVLELGSTHRAPLAAAEANRRPNILIIVTDDQRGGMSAMPETRKRFVRQGVQYFPAFATTPLCCPARASIMTGRYAHNHGVKTNANPVEPGAEALDHSTTIQRYLDDAGYHTGVIGKFLNEPWEFSAPPPHFDEWATVDGRNAPEDTGEKWYDYPFNVNGITTSTNGAAICRSTGEGVEWKSRGVRRGRER